MRSSGCGKPNSTSWTARSADVIAGLAPARELDTLEGDELAAPDLVCICDLESGSLYF